jgi:hypothetical protein
VKREGEINGGGMTCGARWSVRERGGKGLGWSGAVWASWFPGCGPSGLLASPFYFFFLLLSFSFISDFCFDNLKRLMYSDLNKVKADHFWSLRSVFRTYKPEV